MKEKEKQKEILLIIEKGTDNTYWGRIDYQDNFIIDSAKTILSLERKMKNLLDDFHQIKNIKFSISYDISSFFDQFDYLNKSKIAALSGINPSLIRQYAAGIKFASPTQAKKIEITIHRLAEELSRVSFYA